MNGCRCIDKLNKLLADRGEQLVTSISLNSKPSRVVVKTMSTNNNRKPCATLLATFCPFCGKPYET